MNEHEQRRCAYCRDPMPPSRRSNAAYCSTTCNKRAQRARRRVTEHAPSRRGQNRRIAPPQWEQAIAEWAVWLRAAGRPDTTIGLRGSQTRRLALAFPDRDPWTLTTDDLVSWLASHDWSPETRRSHRSCLRELYKWALRTERISKDPTLLLPTVPLPEGKPRPAPEAVVRSALARAEPRVELMLMLAAQAGLRRAEISRVHSGDLDGDDLRVLGKGGRTRVLPLPGVVAARLRLLPPGWAFPGGIDGHLAPATVGKLLARALEADYTGHTLRHRFASIAYSAERDLRAIQTLLGHSRPETTARYTAVADSALRSAVAAATAGL